MDVCASKPYCQSMKVRIFNHYLYRRTIVQIALDLALVLLATALGIAVLGAGITVSGPAVGMLLLSVAAGILLINATAGLYQASPVLTLKQAGGRAAVALLFALPLTWGIFGLLPASVENPTGISLVAMIAVTTVTLRHVLEIPSSAGRRAGTRILIYGAGAAARLVGQTLQEYDPPAELVGYYPGASEKDVEIPESAQLDPSSPLKQTAQHHCVDEIVVALTERRSGSMPLQELLECKVSGIDVYDIATHFEKNLGQIRIGYVNPGWLIFGDGFDQGVVRTAVKRAFDISCSAILLVLAAPVMLLSALAIKLDSPGPVLYRQERVGLNGTRFSIAKFRSMREDAEKEGRPRWATANDDRVTRVGRLIRLLRIDELPQLFNVLRGDMSLVGPRPERPFFVDQLQQQVPYFAVRHSVKPGVTGWAQVRYPYGSSVEDAIQKLQYDLYYVKNHSLFLDIVILFETVVVVLTGKGAR